MIGLGFEIHDSHMELSNNEGSDEEKELRKQYKCIAPSTVDMLHYAFCYVGQFTGKDQDIVCC